MIIIYLLKPMNNNFTQNENKKKRISIQRDVVLSHNLNQDIDKQIETQNSTKANKIPIENDILKAISKLSTKNSIPIYIVGGYVRDYFLNRERTDFDFTVIGDALFFAKIVAEHFNSKAITYERFFTAMVPLKNNLQLEFVGTRKEEYKDNSRKPIVSVGTLEDDLSRRDFTINAMAASLNKNNLGEVVDLFNGINDLKMKILRTPLDPLTTFNDDPLRMMRAARFAAQLNFTIDPITLDAIKKMSNRLNIISMERISAEFFKILASPNPSLGIQILDETNLLSIFLPEISNLKGVEIVQEGEKNFAHKDVFKHSLKVLDNISKVTDNVYLRFAALIHDIAKPVTKKFNPSTGWSFHGHEEIGARMVEKLFRRLKLPLEHIPYVQTLVRLHQRPMILVDDIISDSAIRRLAVQAGSSLNDLFTLCKADITTKNPNLTQQYLNNYDIVLNKILEVQEKDKLREFQSPVRGEEIMELCNLAPCKAVGIIKSNIEEAILDGIISNDYELAKNYFLQNIDDWLQKINIKDIRKK